MKKPKLIRITTVPVSLEKLLENQARFMSDEYEVVLVSSDPEKLREVGKQQGVRTFAVDLTRKITPLKDLKALWQMYRFLRREKPLIVHSHTPKAGTIGMIAAKLAGVPHRLHTVAGLPLLEATGKKRKVLDAVEKITYSCATRVYPNSFGLKKIIEAEKLCPPSKLKVIGNGSSNGIDAKHFDPALFPDRDEIRREAGLEPDHFVFVFVGRIVKDKGIRELIEAFVKLYDKFPDARLLMIGRPEPHLDPLPEATEKTIETHPGIVSLGFRPDVRPYFAAADALAFPSYREGFPNVVMQAAAMQVPAVVTDINGCNEIIREGVNGLIVPVKNAAALFEKMEYLYSAKDKARQMGKASRAIICEGFSREFVWNALRDEYRFLTKTN